jgi:hypothetical protein
MIQIGEQPLLASLTEGPRPFRTKPVAATQTEKASCPATLGTVAGWRPVRFPVAPSLSPGLPRSFPHPFVSGQRPGALQRPGCSRRLNRRSFDMAFLYSDPFETLFQFQKALDQFRSSNWLQASPSGGGRYPPMNIFRKGEDIVLLIEVPGVRKSDLRIEAKGNTVRIAGTKTVE